MTSRSEHSRHSKYASSAAITESPSHAHLSHMSHRRSESEVFTYPRPEDDEEIEMLFESMLQKRKDGDDRPMPDLTIEQKWQLVYNDKQLEWRRQADRQSRKPVIGNTGSGMTDKSPEWYLRKFLDQTIRAEDISELAVCLANNDLE